MISSFKFRCSKFNGWLKCSPNVKWVNFGGNELILSG